MWNQFTLGRYWIWVLGTLIVYSPNYVSFQSISDYLKVSTSILLFVNWSFINNLSTTG